MNQNPESPRTASSSAAPLATCAYCGAPLPKHQSASSQKDRNAPRFCCYGCRVLGESAHHTANAAAADATPWFKIAVGAALAVQGMLLGLAVSLAPPSGPVRGLLHSALALSSVAALVILGRPLFRSAIDEIRGRRISIELLFLAGIVGALGASVSSSLSGSGPVYYEVAAVLVTVYAVGKTLGAQSRARALAETRQLQQTFETCQKMTPNGSWQEVAAASIRVGDLVRVLAGQPIPIDGRIVQGEAFVCETPLTGEPFPAVRRCGDGVFAGSYSEDGELRIEATAPGNQRRLDGLLAALATAREGPCRLQAQADKLVRWFLPLTLTVALVVFIGWTWQAGWHQGLFNAMSVLLVACPCAMGLATPVAIWSGLAAMAARGLVLRGGDELERLATVDRMVFDKTGTLSEERLSLVDVVAVGSVEDRRKVLDQLQAVQEANPHPVARAFQSTHTYEPSSVYQVEQVKIVPALGIEAWIKSTQGDEHFLRIGRKELMAHLEGEADLMTQLRRTASDRLIHVEVDGRLRAIAAVSERLRDTAVEAMEMLVPLGIDCAVMTGDSAARSIQLPAGIAIEAGLTPDEKVRRVAALEKTGHRVGYVGDGINDAPAMRAATVGIALAHGAGVTTAWAGALLYGGDLRVVPWALALSRQVRNAIQSNLLFAAGYNLLGMTLAASGLLHPVAAALLMVISSFTVSWRSLRAAERVNCCVVPTSVANPALPISSGTNAFNAALPASSKPDARWQIIQGALLALQALFLIYFGQIKGLEAVLTLLIFALMGVGIIAWRARNPEWRRIAFMAFAMLGLGNWGMLLGWWADSGFASGVAGCVHCATARFSLMSFTNMPWMNLGMLAFGLPPMLASPEKPVLRLGRWSLGILSGVGMIWGMSYGNQVLMHWIGTTTISPVLLSYAGMTLGMLAGMFLFCEFGRAISLALGRFKKVPGSQSPSI